MELSLDADETPNGLENSDRLDEPVQTLGLFDEESWLTYAIAD
jgi:hypothetical protein